MFGHTGFTSPASAVTASAAPLQRLTLRAALEFYIAEHLVARGSDPMNREQFKHLQGRLENAARTLRSAYKRPSKPADVVRAQQKVRAWEEREERMHDAHRARVDKRVCAVRESLYFDDPTKALAAVRKLEIEAGK